MLACALRGAGERRLVDRCVRELERALEVDRAMIGGVLAERSLARRAPDARKLLVGTVERVERLLSRSRDEQLLARREEALDPFPVIAQDRRAARGRLEQSARRAEAHLRHRAARHVQRDRRRAEERRMLGWRQVANEEQVRQPGKIVWIRRA